jgi:PhnB protein
MTVRLNPYLSFGDNAREAMEHYRSVFGGELDITTFAEGGASDEPGERDKIMHAHLTTPAGFDLMASDTPQGMEVTVGNNVAVSLSGDDEDQLRGYWEKLEAGSTIVMPFEKAPWGDTFGMCIDRFGVNWMINIAGTPA